MEERNIKKTFTEIEQRALEVLTPLGALTIDMQEAIRRAQAETVFADENSVLLYHSCSIPMLWCANKASGEAALDTLCKRNAPVRLLVTHGEAAMKAARDKLGFDIGEACIQFCRFSKEKLPMKNIGKIRSLDMGDLDEVNARYALGGPEHNEQAIKSGNMFGIEIDGRLAGFIGMHSEGSVGMMEVFPEYRRRGLGTELESYMHNMHIDRGWIPYGQVYVSNAASLEMQAKFGLTRSEDHIWWTLDPSIRRHDG